MNGGRQAIWAIVDPPWVHQPRRQHLGPRDAELVTWSPDRRFREPRERVSRPAQASPVWIQDVIDSDHRVAQV